MYSMMFPKGGTDGPLEDHHTIPASSRRKVRAATVSDCVGCQAILRGRRGRFLPRSAVSAGLQQAAAKRAVYNALWTPARPPPMERLPHSRPLSRLSRRGLAMPDAILNSAALEVLRRYPRPLRMGAPLPLGNRGGFSGARLWRFRRPRRPTLSPRLAGRVLSTTTRLHPSLHDPRPHGGVDVRSAPVPDGRGDHGRRTRRPVMGVAGVASG